MIFVIYTHGLNHEFIIKFYLNPRIPPAINDSKKRITATINTTFAIAAALAAIPVNPNNAATIATIKKIITKRNIVYNFLFLLKL